MSANPLFSFICDLGLLAEIILWLSLMNTKSELNFD